MLSLFHRAIRISAAVTILTLFVAGCSDNDHHSSATPTAMRTSTPVATATPTVPCPLPSPFCGGDFPLNTEQTTEYGPAWADVSVGSNAFVPCFGPYALCFYSECKLSPDGKVSDCPCFAWYGINYVLVAGILNLDVYEATVSQCNADPDSCQTPNGAPVCGAIHDGTFYDSAKLVSTFGFYRAAQEPIGLTNCDDQPGPYSGCMTAPCFGDLSPNPDGTVSISCDCPNFDGPFQIGKTGLTCEASEGMTWSAAYNPSIPSNPCELVGDGTCIPDAPPPCGCPLYVPGSTMLPPGSGIDCEEVCNEYATCQRNESLQLGFTCDATLCTSDDRDLLLDACNGLQNCDLSEIFAAEEAADCSCCASQLCGCEPNAATNNRIYELNAAQRADGDVPQCDINDTLCGTAP